MQKIITLFCLMFILSGLSAQPTITKNDMPVVGDTIWFNTTTFVSGLDYEATGNNYSWDFSSLNGTPAADTFISVSSTSITLQFVFGLGAQASNLAQNSADLSFIPGIPISGFTNFYRNSTAAFQFSGYGVGFGGIGIPIKFNNADVWYKFPLTINSPADSSHSTFAQSLLSYGYLRIDRKRVNEVDGWGTLITPYGSFQTLRMKSVVHEEDSLYLDTLGVGLPLVRDYVEYKWLGNGHGEPLLTVTEEGPLVTWKWIDNPPTVGIQQADQEAAVRVSPNPASDYIHLTLTSRQEGSLSISLWNSRGQQLRELYHGRAAQGISQFNFPLEQTEIASGLYFLRIKIDQQEIVRKLLIEN
jgi:hypothetical protein